MLSQVEQALDAVAGHGAHPAVGQLGVKDAARDAGDAAAQVEAVTAALRDTPKPPEQVARVYAAYEDAKVSADGDRLLDFDDLLIFTAQMLTVASGRCR